MAGRFEGLSDLEWKLFKDIFPETPKKRSRGMPPVPFRYVLNSLLVATQNKNRFDPK